MRQILIMFLTGLVLTGCITTDNKTRETPVPSPGRIVKYAGGFELADSDSGMLLIVKNPWQHASGIEYRYSLSDSAPESQIIDEYNTIIKTPVKRIICLSTTHIGFIGFINKTGSIVGVSGKKYVVNDSVRKAVTDNRVPDVGYDENLNFELILDLKPDVVFAYGVNVSITNTVRKLNEFGIPVVLIGEYLEQDPLAKMEWVKAIAACFDVLPETIAQFDSVAGQYNQLKALAEKSEDRPFVLLGLPWRGNWYVSGSKSYIARLINDAGGRYIWENLNYNESVPVSLEKIYENALTAEFWINPGEARSKNDIISVDERFKSLPAIASGMIFNNDMMMSISGGNGFYESGVVEPDRILADLIYILHPYLLPSHKLKYYRKLQ